MIWFALVPALLCQDIGAPPVPSSQERYRPPVVRPFEPLSDFGREKAQGDDEAEVWRRPLTAPVTVDLYRHSYEVSRGDGEIAYDQAVAQAEIDADIRMGPLDGRWRVLDEDGNALLSLVLSDRGADKAVEGAWRRPGREGVATDLEPVVDVRRDPVGQVAVSLGDAALTLSPAEDGDWVGLMTRDGEARAIVVRRPA